LAQVAFSKYGDHLQLYRFEGIFRRQGVELSRQNDVRLNGSLRETGQPGVGTHEAGDVDLQGGADR